MAKFKRRMKRKIGSKLTVDVETAADMEIGQLWYNPSSKTTGVIKRVYKHTVILDNPRKWIKDDNDDNDDMCRYPQCYLSDIIDGTSTLDYLLSQNIDD